MVDNQNAHSVMSLLGYPSIIVNASNETFLEIRVNEFFREKGVHKYLLRTMKKFYSIKKNIEDINCKLLYSEDLRTVRSTLDGSSRGNSNEENVVVGLDDDTKRIVERLTRPPPFRLEILTVVGMGIGKTTLVRKVFDHSSVVSHFHCRAWITVSKVYQEKDLLFRLLCSVSQPTYRQHEKSNEDIGEDLYKKLKGRMYLIVVDDLWSINAWKTVERYLPDDKNGSRIILTSRSIITELKLEGHTHHFMRLLDRDQSWKLLEMVVFGTKSCPQELEGVGHQIASKCGGLPLAIVVIAGLLSRITRTRDCWNDIADTVKSLVCVDPQQCLEILALSYSQLPNHLKECFLYLGAFPEDVKLKLENWLIFGLPKAFWAQNLQKIWNRLLKVTWKTLLVEI
ncbi:hypothetical protein ACH5RR_018120 [Cinchona calisaya]|uniref:NB-ARC domain-containing protein n=1 Tax=Cinchona calisaya TaxID=153742 RepID=A0ABD2ZM80_9GENT